MTAGSPVISYRARGVEVLQLNHPKPQNPFTEAMRVALCESLIKSEHDSEVGAVILTGGPGRSFCAGGDFVEVGKLHTPQEVQVWMAGIIEMYRIVLSVNKPLIVAIDKYAMGLGLQLALLGDWRVGTEDCLLSMPELKVGVACTVGATILNHCFGRNLTTRVIYGCDMIGGQAAFEMKLIDELVPSSELLERALNTAERLSSYHHVPFTKTKQCINQRFIEVLNENLQRSTEAHSASFAANSSIEYMRRILKQGHEETLQPG